jgi:hypothetical protein
MIRLGIVGGHGGFELKWQLTAALKAAGCEVGEGISRVGDLFDMAVKTEVINKNGVW